MTESEYIAVSNMRELWAARDHLSRLQFEEGSAKAKKTAVAFRAIQELSEEIHAKLQIVED